jgi:hypothetical protein
VIRVNARLRSIQGVGTMDARNSSATAPPAHISISTRGLSMATENKTGTGREGDRPAGSHPTRNSKRDDERVREEAKSESTGDAPMDPADDSFIKSK